MIPFATMQSSIAAEPVNQAEQEIILSSVEPENDSIAEKVKNASTPNEAREILLDDGFEITSSENGVDRLEKKEGDYAIGYEIPAEKSITPYADIGFDWKKGPYVKAPPHEWLKVAQFGTSAAPGLCALISNVFGAVICGVISGVASKYINDQNIKEQDTICIAVNPARSAWIVPC